MSDADADDARQRQTTKSVKLTEATHGRLKEHCREGETLSGAVDRALDADDILSSLAGIEDPESVVSSLTHRLQYTVSDGEDIDCEEVARAVVVRLFESSGTPVEA